MKKILLLGDSIRMGYCGAVRELLKGKAEVYFSNDNGRFLQYTLRALSDWKGAEKWPDDIDTVHWNNGLWDLLHLNAVQAGEDGEAAGETIAPPVTCRHIYDKEPLTPPEMYEYMLKRVRKRIRQIFPGAEIVFATTTPVIEEDASWAFRSNKEIDEYNGIARRTLPPLGVRINELGEYAKKHCWKTCSRDWVHYNDKGSLLLAQEIIDYLKNEGLL